LKPTPVNSSTRPYLEKNPSQKRAGGVAQGVGPEFKPQYWKKKTKKIPKIFWLGNNHKLAESCIIK
jgi:hypothetical protein